MITTRLCSGMLAQGEGDLVEEHTSYRMLGPAFVCPECVVDKVCSEARFLHTVADLNSLGLRLELRNQFFDVVTDVLSDAASAPKRSRRV